MGMEMEMGQGGEEEVRSGRVSDVSQLVSDVT